MAVERPMTWGELWEWMCDEPVRLLRFAVLISAIPVGICLGILIGIKVT